LTRTASATSWSKLTGPSSSSWTNSCGAARIPAFDHLGQPSPKFIPRQRCQDRHVHQDGGLPFEGTDQVSALRQIDAGFATDRSVDHGEQ
jgi:hypothetical protein